MTLTLVSSMQERTGTYVFEMPKLPARFNGGEFYLEIDPADLADPTKAFSVALRSTDQPPGQDLWRLDHMMTWEGGETVDRQGNPLTGVYYVVGDDGTARRLQITVSVPGTLRAALWVDQ